MSPGKYTTLLHLVGPVGSGKSTLCRLFLDSFSDKSVLVVDASSDQLLLLSYGLQASVTVATLMQQMSMGPMTREAVDWALQDLPVSIAAEADAELLAWGDVPVSLSDVQLELMNYALPRLFREYDVVIWDGPLGLVEQIYPKSEISTLLVITPKDEAFCQEVRETNAMVLLSKAEASDILPPTAVMNIQSGNWKFLGKLPPLSPPERRIRELPQYFQDCLHKLDLPFELRSSSL